MEKTVIEKPQEKWGKIRSFFWPIHRYELTKFVPIALIFALLAFIYDMLRCLKTSLVVSASHVGAEIIPFIKVWAMLPGAFLFVGLFIKLSHRFNREQTFYIIMSIFVGFFASFMMFIYPNREALALSSLASTLLRILPSGAIGFAMMLQYWPLTLFYVMTELWGAIALSMLFWGFANEVTSVEEAKRFYPFFLLAANIAAVFAGKLGADFTDHTFNPALPFGVDAWEQSLSFFLGSAVLSGLAIMGLFRWMHQKGLAQKSSFYVDKTVKLSMKECVLLLGKSKHILYIALLVLSYNIVFNLSDVLWSHQLKLRFVNNVTEMTRYLSQMTMITGAIAFFISLLISGNLLRRFGWKATALMTPLMISVSSIGFFFFLFFHDIAFVTRILDFFALSSLDVIILFGAIQMCFSRSCKYTVFDTSKEIAFIPLSTQEQRYGKAAIDGVGSRLGKSTGSFIFQILFLICSSIAETTPFVAVIICLVLAIWYFSILALAPRLQD